MQQILLNLLFLLLGIFLYMIFLHNTEIEKKNRCLFIGLSAFLTILICKQIPIPIFLNGVFEFKHIPFLLGSLYGGRNVAVSLFISLTVLNISIGDENFTSDVFLSTILFTFILLVFLPMYERLTKTQRVIACIFVLFFFSFARFILNLPDFLETILYLETILFFSLVKAGSIGIIVYIAEYIRETTLLKEETEKCEQFRVVSELAASVSHEVRNPLAVTRGFIQLLYDPNLESATKKRYVELSIQELDRAQEIITDYLGLMKEEEKAFYISTINVGKQLEYLADVMKPLANNANVDINLDLIHDLFIKGDEKKFRQILVNLVKNSIEAMEKGGTIILLASKNGHGEAIVSIKDTGIGISNEQLARLGSPFFSSKAKGTGLGLTYVYNNIKLLGGRIEVESTIGQGTTFNLFFSLEKQV